MLEMPGEYRARLPLPFEVGETEGGTDQIQVALEGSVPIVCYVWEGESELGVTVMRTADLLFESLSQELGEIGHRSLTAIDAGALGGAPFHAASWLFTADASSLGLLKIAAANKQGRGMACNHWDAGYRQTFERVFSDLVESFQVAEPPPVPYYAEIFVMRMNDLPVGVEQLEFSMDAEGDTRVKHHSSTLIPTSQSELVSTYSVSVEWSRPDGALINSYSSETGVDGTHTELMLRRNEIRGWHVTGKLQDKELDADVEHEGSIDTSLGESIALRERLVPLGDETVVRQLRWVPEVDPTGVLDVSLEGVAGDPPGLRLRFGPIEMTAVRDPLGMARSGTVRAGRIEMALERVYQDGGF